MNSSRMRYLFLTFVFVLISFSTLFAQHINKIVTITWQGEKTEVGDGTIIVKLVDTEKKGQFKNDIASLNFKVIREPDKRGVAILHIPQDKTIVNSIEKLKKIENLQYVEPDFITRISIAPNDPYYSYQWAHQKIKSPLAWNIETGSNSTIVGILDTGISIEDSVLTHPDLNDSNRIILGYDFAGDSAVPRDDNGHGTHVAGILSAETNNSIGVAGMNWNTKLLIIKVFDAQGIGFSSFFYDGVISAVDSGAKIINYSGGGNSSQTMEEAIEYAESYNCIIVASAGNSNNSVIYPAAYSSSYENVIAVSATNSSDNLADFSCYGPEINVSAPGVNIYSTMPDYPVTLNNEGFSQNYDYMDGTSMAAPHVSGLASLLKAMYPTWSPQKIRTRIENTAKDLGVAGFDHYYGHGRIDAWEALRIFEVPQDYSTIQSAIDAAVGGCLVQVSPGTYTGNITMKPGVGVIGTGGGTTTINGTVTFNNTLGAGLSNVTVNNKITINHSDNVSLSNVTAGHASCWLDISNSNMLSLDDFTSHVSRTQAVYAHNSSYLTLWHGSLKNKSDGIYIAGSSADLLHVELCQNNYDIAAIVSSVLAFKCFYSNSVPGSTIYNYNSTVDWFWWNACGGGGGGFPKGAGREEPETFDIEKEPAWESYKEALEIWRDFTEAIREENKSEEKRPLSEYRSAAVLVTEPFKQIISQYSQSPLAVLSLSRLASLLLALEADKELEAYMHALLQEKEKSPLAPWAQNALASLSIRRHDYKKAVSIYDDLLKTLPEHEQAVEWLYSKAVLYQYHLDQPGTAEKLFRQIITDWPEHLTAQSAADELGQPSAQRSAHAAEQKGGMLVTEELEFAASNYPNPFNPETIISFTLPEPGSVSVKVYDITGRQIRTLSEKDYTTGAHQLIWEGTDQRGLAVSSGVYFYRIEFEGRQITGKMLLVR